MGREDYYSCLPLYFFGSRRLSYPVRNAQKKQKLSVALGRRGTTFGAATPPNVVFPGVLAQLVQSATLTRWRSLVRAQYASQKNPYCMAQ